MKTKFNSIPDVMHKFAERSQDAGISGNVFFEKDKIYSYGYHYVLAQFLKIPNGEIAILINNKGYSSSTSEHINTIREATRQYQQFFTKDVDFELVYENIIENYKLLLKARKPEMYAGIIASKFILLFSYPLFELKDVDAKKLKEIKGIVKIISASDLLVKAKEDEKIKAKKLDEKRQKKLKKDISDFLKYKIDYIHGDVDFLRISKNRLFVETSQSVQINIKEAKMLYLAILKGADIVGYEIGYYTVKSIDNSQLTVGCHRINLESVKTVGEQIITK